MRSKRPSGTKQAIWRSSKRPFGAKEAEFTASRLLQVIPEFLAAGRVAELAQRLGLDLADALSGHPEPLADLFQRALVAVDQPKPQLQHAPGNERPKTPSTAYAFEIDVDDTSAVWIERRSTGPRGRCRPIPARHRTRR